MPTNLEDSKSYKIVIDKTKDFYIRPKNVKSMTYSVPNSPTKFANSVFDDLAVS